MRDLAPPRPAAPCAPIACARSSRCSGSRSASPRSSCSPRSARARASTWWRSSPSSAPTSSPSTPASRRRSASRASSAARRASSRSTTPRRSPRVPGVETVVPVAMGLARVEAGERGRSVSVLGATPDLPTLWRFGARQGSFWPQGDPRRGAPLAVLGPKLARELFGERSPLGEFVRIAGGRFRVIGVMEPKGQMMGFDIDDVAYVPVGLGDGPLQPGRAVRDRRHLLERAGRRARRGGGEARPRRAPRRDGGLHRHLPGGHARRLRQGHGRRHDGGGRHRRHLAARGSHRDPDHDVDRGRRAHERDRPGARARGHAAARCRPSSSPRRRRSPPSAASPASSSASGSAPRCASSCPACRSRRRCGSCSPASRRASLTGLVSGVAPARRAASLDPIEALRAE